MFRKAVSVIAVGTAVIAGIVCLFSTIMMVAFMAEGLKHPGMPASEVDTPGTMTYLFIAGVSFVIMCVSTFFFPRKWQE